MTSLPFSLNNCVYLVVLSSLLAGCVLSEIECNHTITKHAWFDIFIKDYDGPGEDFHGRFVIGLFGDAAPATVLNFASIAKGYKHDKTTLHYKNTKVHRVVRDFVIQMGDVTVGDGTGGKSIYGETFDDEDYILSHRSAGFVSMANHGKNTNGSQFFILLVRARWLDKRHVVFGKVIKGFDVIRKISEIETNKETGMPKKKIKIVDCGSDDVKKYCLSEAEIEVEEDIEKD